MTEIDARLREDVHYLGTLLGQTIQAHLGADFLQRIERIRLGAKQGRKQDGAAHDELLAALLQLCTIGTEGPKSQLNAGELHIRAGELHMRAIAIG